MNRLLKLFAPALSLVIFSLLLAACQTAPIDLSKRRVPPPASPLSFADKNYQRLHEALPLYQKAVLHPWTPVPAAAKFKLNQPNPATPLLIARLQATDDLPANYFNKHNRYDAALAAGVENFQRRHGLKADGVVGKHTLYELNVPPGKRMQQLQINMLRWTMLAPRLGDQFVMVNIPDFQLYLVDHNQKALTMKVIVGKTTRKTPEIHSNITRLVLNPYWNVPKMIANKDIIQKVIDDPEYLDTMQIKVFKRQENNAIEIDPEEIDWEEAQKTGFHYHFRQEPGDDNALGLIKFEFKNSDDIYLHDTPAKELFSNDTRALSSGCIRLERPFDLADYLMRGDPQWSEERKQALLAAGKTSYIKIPRPMPIFIIYITAWVDEEGVINFRDDIYQQDS